MNSSISNELIKISSKSSKYSCYWYTCTPERFWSHGSFSPNTKLVRGDNLVGGQLPHYPSVVITEPCLTDQGRVNAVYCQKRPKTDKRTHQNRIIVPFKYAFSVYTWKKPIILLLKYVFFVYTWKKPPLFFYSNNHYLYTSKNIRNFSIRYVLYAFITISTCMSIMHTCTIPLSLYTPHCPEPVELHPLHKPVQSHCRKNQADRTGV